MRYTIFVIAMVCTTFNVAHAARPKYYSQSTVTTVKNHNYTMLNTSDDQSRCQAEADYMARNHITGHVWGVIGSFEGVGYGNSPNCNTCVPSSNMRLTGDASAQDNNGKWYRVRSWR